MSKYHFYRKKPKRFLRLTGYTIKEFDALQPTFATNFEKHMEKYTLNGKERTKRKYVAYSNSALPSGGEKLFFILSYLKSNALQDFHAALFGMSQPRANLWIHCLLPVLFNTLQELSELPARTVEALTLQLKGESLFFHDATERPIPRPLDYERQRLYYSGKAHAHTLKNQLLINPSCRLLFLSPTVEGKMHDKKLADQSPFPLEKGDCLLQDAGFQGFTLEDVKTLQPKKKKKGQPLSDFDKSINQWIASFRIRIEHAIGGIQRFRIVQDKIRIWKGDVRDTVMAICCGLHNFRLKFRPWHYDPIQLHLFVDF